MPGVKDLLNERVESQSKSGPTRGGDGREMRDIYATCDAEYFGYDDLYNPQADSRLDELQSNNSRLSDVNANANDKSNDDGDNESRDATRQRILALERAAEHRLRAEVSTCLSWVASILHIFF